VGSVDKRLSEIELSAVAKILCERSQNFHEHAIAHPLLQPTMARLVRRILAGQRSPRRAGPKHPQDPVEHRARFNARPSFAVATTIARNQRRDDIPLLVREFHIDV
jgi:hypothetical protein